MLSDHVFDMCIYAVKSLVGYLVISSFSRSMPLPAALSEVLVSLKQCEMPVVSECCHVELCDWCAVDAAQSSKRERVYRRYDIAACRLRVHGVLSEGQRLGRDQLPVRSLVLGFPLVVDHRHRKGGFQRVLRLIAVSLVTKKVKT